MSAPTKRTRINASHIIAYDHAAGGHRYLRDGVIVVEGESIAHVGKSYDGTADETIDATGRIVTPGFVNVHAHLAGSPLDKSFIEDRGPRQFYLSGLFEFLPARGAAQDAEATRACFDYSMVELLRTGTTTILEMGPLVDEAVESAVQAG
ncbi:MAG: amidohydrolase family protein, partial [Chloroflexia bacterium]